MSKIDMFQILRRKLHKSLLYIQWHRSAWTIEDCQAEIFFIFADLCLINRAVSILFVPTGTFCISRPLAPSNELNVHMPQTWTYSGAIRKQTKPNEDKGKGKTNWMGIEWYVAMMLLFELIMTSFLVYNIFKFTFAPPFFCAMSDLYSDSIAEACTREKQATPYL